MGVYREFGADPELKSLYRAYALFVLVGGFLWWLIPLEIALTLFGEQLAAGIVASTVVLPVAVAFLVTLYWIPRFFDKICYGRWRDCCGKGCLVENKKPSAL